MSPRLEINYCTQCRWLLRAAWLAQELLTTFEAELGEVALVPGTGGVFRIVLDGELLWDRKERGSHRPAAGGTDPAQSVPAAVGLCGRNGGAGGAGASGPG
ncbi:MAG TPA: Rdx family protein [Pseudonocardia sp.]|nr:Rdx family protein [Pseudonocardia sp.]